VPTGCGQRGALNVIAKDRPRVGVRLLDGCAGEADESRVRQGIAHVPGEPINEVVLRTGRFIRDHDDVPARRQLRPLLAIVWEELMDRREHHAAAGPVWRSLVETRVKLAPMFPQLPALRGEQTGIPCPQRVVDWSSR